MAAPPTKKLKSPPETLADEVAARAIQVAYGKQLQRLDLLERYVENVERKRSNIYKLTCDFCKLPSLKEEVEVCSTCRQKRVCAQEYCKTFAFRTPHGFYCSEHCVEADLCLVQNCRQCTCHECGFKCCELCDRAVCNNHAKEAPNCKDVCFTCIEKLANK